jgi:hypothetical protein
MGILGLRREMALACLVVAGGVLMTAGPVAAAETFVVRSPLDDGDNDVGDDICDAAAGILTVCTFRAAIEEANADADQDRIEFQIGGPNASGVKAIQPGSDLPSIDEPLIIDGYTQPGASPNTRKKGTNAKLRIALDGSGGGTGLLVQAPTQIRGLVIRDFNFAVVLLNDAIIAGNFIGTNASGTTAAPNGIGVHVLGPNIRVGGGNVADRNLLSGNGTAILINSPGGARIIRGNLIGTRANGTGDLGNDIGVHVDDASSEISIGGAKKPMANVIAFNDGAGIELDFITGSADALVRRNAIFANGGLGIDLEADGVTANDNNPPLNAPPPPDTDAGANDLQNFPLINSARTGANGTTIKGVLRSDPSKTYRIEFFSNPGGNEGKKYIGSKVVTTNGDGIASWTFKPARKVPLGKRVTATASDLSDDETSEFSAPRTVAAQ